jgi:hypothetical protein
LKFVSQPEEHTKPSDTSSSGINARPSESARHPSRLPLASRAPGTTGTARAPAWDSRRSSTLCIALAACVGELFDLSSGLRLQPRTVDELTSRSNLALTAIMIS